MRIAYFDAFSGISGDMTIGAFLDLGMPLDALEAGLAPLRLAGVSLERTARIRSGICATKFTVHLARTHAVDPGQAAPGVHAHGDPHEHAHAHPHPHSPGHDHAHPPHHSHRTYREIRALLDDRPLLPRVRKRAQEVFRALALAEARIHGCAPEDVTFHEVGALDAIVDVVGAALCLEHFGVEKIHVSPLPLGSGLVTSQHGAIPVPAPATIELLRGFATLPREGDAELVTPTGAAIVAALASSEPAPPMSPIAIGYGAGDRELADRPNLLRVILAEPRTSRPGPSLAPHTLPGLEQDEMVVLEANIDDMSPELFEAAVEALFAAGARDVTLGAITMKRGRPGTLLTVIAHPDDRQRMAAVMLRETSTIGVRTYGVSRLVLPRTQRHVATRYGLVEVKVATLPDGSERVAPEYQDCHRIARERGLPVATVYAEALHAARAEPREGE